MIPEPPEGHERWTPEEGEVRPDGYLVCFPAAGTSWGRGYYVGVAVEAQVAVNVREGIIGLARPIRKEQP